MIGKGILNAVGGGVLGELVLEVLPDVARDVCEWWSHDRSADEQRLDVESLAAVPQAEVGRLVQEVVADVAGDKPLEVQQSLGVYLSLVPGAIRQSLRRPADPSGVSVPPLLSLKEPDDVLSLLPAQLPRFQPGMRPLPGIDWELVELLGCGGFGEVWKARNPHFDGVPPVALKFCLDAAAKDRLLRHEAAVLNQVMRQGRHPGIVALLHTYLSADPPCLEYEYVAGGDLTGLITEWRSLPVNAERAQRVAKLIQNLAATVGHAHRLTPPVVHRDLKPANILIQTNPDGSLQPRIADFGIGGVAASQALARTNREVSQAGFLVTALRGSHTPLYASPQQARGRSPDPRDDVFSLGVIWYQMLTSNLTSSRPGGSRWTQRLIDQGVSADMVELLGSCIEEEPQDRPNDALELSEKLSAIVSTAKPTARVEPVVPAELPSSLVNSLGMNFVLIPAGSFVMGSETSEVFRGPDEGPRRRVTISRAFYLGVHLVTQRDYEAVMGGNPSYFTSDHDGSPMHPVEQVSWDDANQFCHRLSQRFEEQRAGRRYSLPTEAEWEYACRAGTTTPFSLVSSINLTVKEANFDGSHAFGAGEVGAALGRTSKVGSYASNAWGLFDMHGNVWEWTADWYADSYGSANAVTDPTGAETGTQRILRGGSWNNSGFICRSARRNKIAPHFRNSNIGFRVVLRIEKR
jgi:formylglycine-generating enzyme required for sulfatase activity